MVSTPDGPSFMTLPGVELLEHIGRGGFATVYRGWQPAFHRAVAVKILDRDPDGSSSARFKKEVRALGSLSGHPHVVAVYEAGTVDDRPYLLMPFLSGGHLGDRLRAQPLEPQAAVKIMADIAGAVATAHGLGILHRDIKPANILFTSYGEAQLADFGIARLADATLTSDGLIAATVTYAAPEVLGGAIATEAADIYSLGATLYAALRGAPPFEPRSSEAPIAFALRVLKDPAPGLQSAGIPAALAAVVDKAMAKQPADRYQSAQAFRDALLGVDLLASAFTPPPPPPPPLLPPVVRSDRRRRPRRAAAIGTALAVLVAGGTAAATELSDGSSRSDKTTQRGPSPTVPSPPTESRTSATPPSTAPTSTAPSSTAPPSSAAPSTARRSTAVATTAPPTTAPSTSLPSSMTVLTGSQPPLAGGSTSASALTASTLTNAVDDYYALVNQHRLSDSWNWLSPAYQQRLGWGYYYRFWEGIGQVQLFSVLAQTGAAALELRYVETNGTVSTERAELTFVVDPSSHRILINSYRVTG